MQKILRNGEDYWSNDLGWTEFPERASFFLKDEPLTGMEGDRELVTDSYAGRMASRQLRQDNDGDSWGWAMSWFFSICDTMVFDRGMQTPSEWRFRPSPMGKNMDDEWKDEILSGVSDGQLAYLGDMLHRYTEILRKAGKDY